MEAPVCPENCSKWLGRFGPVLNQREFVYLLPLDIIPDGAHRMRKGRKEGAVTLVLSVASVFLLPALSEPLYSLPMALLSAVRLAKLSYEPWTRKGA